MASEDGADAEPDDRPAAGSAATAPESQPQSAAADDWEAMRPYELKKECKKRGLSDEGLKGTLIARLRGELDEDAATNSPGAGGGGASSAAAEIAAARGGAAGEQEQEQQQQPAREPEPASEPDPAAQPAPAEGAQPAALSA